MGKYAVNALRGIDLKVHKKDFIAIMGASGSGKSTLMHILGGLDVPTRGHAVIRDWDNNLVDLANLTKDHLSEIRLSVTGFIFQQFYLLPTLTAIENISIPLIFVNKPSSFVKKRSSELLDMVGLKERGHHLPSELSGGEQQRVAIARAIANDPQLILADEPTGDLDSVTGKMVINILKELNQMGKTVVMVTHAEEIANYAKSIVQMKDGKLIK